MPARWHASTKALKSSRRAVAAGRREEAGDLVAPRAAERVLQHRQQLDVREAHAPSRTARAARPARDRSASVARPRARGATSRGAPRRSTSAASNHAFAVRRARPSRRRRATRSPRRRHTIDAVAAALEVAAVRIRLLQQRGRTRADLVLVALAVAEVGDEHLPDAAGTSRRIGCTRPSHPLKSPITLTRSRVRRPDGEVHAARRRRSSSRARRASRRRASSGPRRTGAGRSR